MSIARDGGTVTAGLDGDAHLHCAAPGCTAAFDLGDRVTLQAVATDGWAFLGWTGACVSGTVTMDGPQACGATFVPLHRLTVTKTGDGSGLVTVVIRAPSGGRLADCRTSPCSRWYPEGTDLVLGSEAMPPYTGVTLVGFGGACAANGSVSMTTDKSCTAAFKVTYPKTAPADGTAGRRRGGHAQLDGPDDRRRQLGLLGHR